MDHVKQTYHFAGTGIDGKIVTVDVYMIPCEITTQQWRTVGGVGVFKPPPEIPKISVESSIA